MSWLPIALSTAALGSLVSITDKIVVERYLRDPWSFPFFTALFLGLYCSALLLVRGALGLFQLPPLPVLAVALLPGALHFVSSLFYTRALQQTDASTVSALNQTIPLFALVWGWLFFGNVFLPINYVGVIVVVVCCALLGMEQAPGSQRLRLSPAVWLVLVGALLRSLSDLFIKVTLTEQDYWNTFGLSRAVLLPISIVTLLHPIYRKSIGHSVRVNGLRIIPGIALLEVVAMVPQLLGVIAYGLGPLALVSTIIYSTPFFVLIFTQVLNTLRPGLVPVKTGAQSLGRQAVLILGVMVGVILLRIS
jgi:drug/metabolite transporter (DMT)-like permease